MIEILEIEAQNFLTFRTLPATKIADLGLVFVKGKNLDDINADSNDAGKTNLFNLISWVLYERLAKAGNRVVGDEVVNTQAGAECWGRILLKVDEHECTVMRRRGCRGHKNGAEVAMESLVAKGNRAATNEEIEKILGMTYSMFLSSVFWAQGTATRRLTQLTDAEYKALFDELVGTDHFEIKRKKFSRKVAEIDNMVQSLDISISRLEGGINATKEALENTRPKWPKVDFKFIKNCAARLELVSQEITKNNDALTAARRSVSTMESELQWKKTSAQKLEHGSAQIKTSLVAKVCSLCGQKLKDDQATGKVMAEVNKQTRDISSLQLEISQLAKNLAIAKKRQAGLEQKEKELDDHYNAGYEAALKRLPEELENKDLSAAAALIEEDQKKVADPTLAQRLRDLTGQLRSAGAKRTEVQALKDKYEILARAYGPLGMKSMRLAELTPLLNEKAAEYSDQLSGGILQINFSTVTELKSGELKEKYCVDVQKDQDVNFQLSGGGMTRKADLIAAFALDEVREIMTGKRMLIKVYDEATDGLDAAGEASIVDLLRNKISGTAFFVSHKSLVGENMFDHVWEVARENRESKLSVMK